MNSINVAPYYHHEQIYMSKPGRIFLDGNFPWGVVLEEIFLGVNFPGGGGVVRVGGGGDFLGGNCPGENFPGGVVRGEFTRGDFPITV